MHTGHNNIMCEIGLVRFITATRFGYLLYYCVVLHVASMTHYSYEVLHQNLA